MSGKEFGHPKSPDSIVAKNLGHLLVGGEELLVFRILEVVLLEISPQ